MANNEPLLLYNLIFGIDCNNNNNNNWYLIYI